MKRKNIFFCIVLIASSMRVGHCDIIKEGMRFFSSPSMLGFRKGVKEMVTDSYSAASSFAGGMKDMGSNTYAAASGLATSARTVAEAVNPGPETWAQFGLWLAGNDPAAAAEVAKGMGTAAVVGAANEMAPGVVG